MRCAECVRGRKLNRGAHSYTSIDCGIGAGSSDAEVRWYLCRSGARRIDGVCWYINSRSHRRTRNCQMICAGFDEDNAPVVSVETLVDVEEGAELFLDYFYQK